MMAKTVTEARRPDATAGTDAIYRSLFDSFDPDQDGRISPLEVLARLDRSGLQPGDPRIAEVRALMASGVEPGTADYDGRTPLHLAAAEGQAEVVRYLLAAGADPRPVDRWGGTPLSDAESNGHTEIAALLRQHAEQVAPLSHRSDQREAAVV